MESIKRFGIKWNLLNDRSARGKKQTIHRLNPADGAGRRAKDSHDESLLRMLLRDLTENVWRPGRDPFAADQPTSARDSNEIELAQMLLEPSCEVGIENLNIIVAEDKMLATAPGDSARVTLANRSGIRNADDLARLVLEQPREIGRHRRKAGVIDRTNDDGNHNLRPRREDG